jgi:transposase-like protein
MTVSSGFTAAEIREFVHEYQVQPHGQKGSWLAAQGVSDNRMRRWREAVFEGDLDRGLIPREGSPVMIPPSKRTALEKARARERAAQAAEVTRLTARVRELEDTNDALGKAIGLLHAMSEHEPAEPETTSDPSDS